MDILRSMKGESINPLFVSSCSQEAVKDEGQRACAPPPKLHDLKGSGQASDTCTTYMSDEIRVPLVNNIRQSGLQVLTLINVDLQVNVMIDFEFTLGICFLQWLMFLFTTWSTLYSFT